MATFDLGIVKGRDGRDGVNGRNGRDASLADAVFNAEYGVTHYVDIRQAATDGKAIFCRLGEDVYQFASIDDAAAVFQLATSNKLYILMSLSDGRWTDSSIAYAPVAHGATHDVDGSDPINIKLDAIGAAPRYYYGTTEIEPGSASDEPEGSLHFVYE